MRRLTDAERAERAVAREQLLAAKRAEREDRRAENKANWPCNPLNANHQNDLAREALIAEMVEPAPVSSLDQLRAIMEDGAASIGQRVDCAEALMGYETAPGSLAHASAEYAAAGSAYVFLKRLSGTPGIVPPLRVKVLRVLATVEAARASRVDADQQAARRQLFVDLVNAARRVALQEAGCWPLPDMPYLLRVTDTFDMPPYPAPSQSGPVDIGNMLDAARALPEHERQRQAEQRRQQMLSVRARNRDDDSWRQLLDPELIDR